MKLIDVKQLAIFLGISPKTIYGWVHREKIPCYKLEGSLRFNLDEIQKWIKSKKHKVRGRVGIL
jgi:excisionase family DNA binding protein